MMTPQLGTITKRMENQTGEGLTGLAESHSSFSFPLLLN